MSNGKYAEPTDRCWTVEADRRLATLISDGADVRTEVRRIAQQVAALHGAAPRSAVIDRAGRPEALHGRWEDNLGLLAGYARGVLDGPTLRRIRDRAHRYLIGRMPLLEDRIQAGAIVAGHGCLLADAIVCPPGEPPIFGRIPWRARVGDAPRHGDVLADIGLLAMDLDRLGAPAEAAALLADYQYASGNDQPVSLAHWYIGYQAVGQAVIACSGAGRPGSAAAPTAELGRLLHLADRHLAAARVRLILVGGLPGTGKSTIAEALSGRYGWPVVRSDLIRRQLAGDTERTPAAPGRGIYRPQWTGATYSTLLDRAADHLTAGRSVLLDATWADPIHRAAAARLARRTAADLIPLDCQTTPELALERLAGRPPGGRDTSGADADIYHYVAEHTAPWPEATRLDTDRPLAETLDQAVRAVNQAPATAPNDPYGRSRRTGRSIDHV